MDDLVRALVVRTDDAPAPAGAYSQGIAVNGFLFTAGFGPHDPSTGRVVGETIEEQTAQVLRNLSAVLEAHGSGLDDVVKTTVHLQNLHRDFAGFNDVYRKSVPGPYPVRTTVGSELGGFLVEMDIIAAVRTPGGLVS